jgi:ABC-type transporter Mla subunit MlaD
MILRRVVEEGDERGLGMLAGEMAHLPKERDFVASTETVAKALKSDKSLRENETLVLGAHKLASMSKRILHDRQSLKPVLENVRDVLAEWNAWVNDDDPTEEEIQAHLERVAGTMAFLSEALSAYDAFVLTKLKEDRGME